MLLGLELHRWSQGRGEVATEWRFRIAPPGEVRRPLVPDIAFVANDLLRGLSHEDVQSPTFAPTVAVEILSAGDDPRDVASKIDVYLRAGTALVIIVDPARRTLTAHDSAQTAAFSAPETFRHQDLAGFELALEPFFSEALDLPSL
jgi:Uma2 family endonuclease